MHLLERRRGARRLFVGLSVGVAVSVLAGVGCGEGDGHGVAASARSGSPAPGSATPLPAAGSLSATPTGSASAPAATPTGGGTTSPFAGRWKGSYRAEKVNPALDPTVKDQVWKDDDGKLHTGTGTIELTVAPDGATTGTVEGALGTSAIHGASDDEMVRALVGSPHVEGPSGTLIGKRESDTLLVEVRTSDGSGKMPRIAKGTLAKVP